MTLQINNLEDYYAQFRFEVPRANQGRVTCCQCGEMWYTSPCWVRTRAKQLKDALLLHSKGSCPLAIAFRQLLARS